VRRETSTVNHLAFSPTGTSHSATLNPHATRAFRWEGRILWLLTIALALLGQHVLIPPHDDDLALGVVLLALAGLGLFALVCRAETLEPPEQPLSEAGSRFPPVAWFIMGLALLIALMALWLLQGRHRDSPCWDVFTLWGTSLALLVLAALVAEADPEHGWRQWPSPGKILSRWKFVLLGGLSRWKFVLLGGLRPPSAKRRGHPVRPPAPRLRPPAQAGLGGRQAGLGGPGRPALSNFFYVLMLARLRVPGTRWLALAGLTLAGLVLRAVALETIPATLGGDEGSQGLEALRFLDGRLQNMFVTGWLGVPTMSFLLQAVTVGLWGNTMFGLRILWAVVGTATLPILYALTRQLFDRRTALVATAFLTTYHYHIHYSRLGSNQVADALFLTAALATLVWGLHSNHAIAFALSGLVAGLGLYFYAGARLVSITLIAVLILALVTQPGWRVPWRHLVLLAAGFLVAAAPLLLLAVQHPDDFNARLNAVGIIQSGWLEREVEITGQPLETILFGQFLKSVLAFNHYWDRVSWYGLRAPLLDLVAGALAVLGLVYAVAHWKQCRYAIPVLWVGLVILFGAFLTENPPSSQRLVGATPALAILVAVGAVRLADLARDLWGRPKVWGTVLAALVGLMAVLSLNQYFLEYTPLRIYGNPNAQAATALGHYLRDHPADRIVYFCGAPRLYFDFGSIGYLAPTARGMDVREPLNGPPDFVDPTYQALFVFVPERLAERVWVEERYPGGTWQILPDHLGQMMLALYEVHP